jgi:hypothetical protein
MMDDNEESWKGFFPSIGQFRNAVKSEREWAAYHNAEPRKMTFVGTVKLHGTNAGITNQAGKLICRSRTRIITPDDDNYGFASHVMQHESIIRDVLPNGATIFGEWCGAGIQNGVGICSEQKLFVVFAMRVDGKWSPLDELPKCEKARVFNVSDFPKWTMEIDFAKPEQSQNKLIKLTEIVEARCPVAEAFGHEGIGEGIVWTPIDGCDDSRHWFKVKGEKHSASKVKVLAAVDVEKFARRDELVSYLVTNARLEQGINLHVTEFGFDLDMKSMGDYLRWVFNDIVKEEADTIASSGFEIKDMGKPISDIAKRFYIDALNA